MDSFCPVSIAIAGGKTSHAMLPWPMAIALHNQTIDMVPDHGGLRCRFMIALPCADFPFGAIHEATALQDLSLLACPRELVDELPPNVLSNADALRLWASALGRRRPDPATSAPEPSSEPAQGSRKKPTTSSTAPPPMCAVAAVSAPKVALDWQPSMRKVVDPKHLASLPADFHASLASLLGTMAHDGARKPAPLKRSRVPAEEGTERKRHRPSTSRSTLGSLVVEQSKKGKGKAELPGEEEEEDEEEEDSDYTPHPGEDEDDDDDDDDEDEDENDNVNEFSDPEQPPPSRSQSESVSDHVEGES